MPTINTEDSFNLFHSIYNVPTFSLILRHFRDTCPRSTYICHDCRSEILFKIVHGASDPSLCNKLGLIPLFKVLQDEGLTSSSNFGLDKSESRVPKPEAADYLTALGKPEEWHKVIKGWGAFLVNYLVVKKGPGYSTDELEDMGKKELGSLVSKLIFLCSGTYTVLDLFHNRKFDEFAEWTAELLASMQCRTGKCKALKWQELVGKNPHGLSGSVKSLDGEDAIVWARIVMFSVRSLLEPSIRQVIDKYPGLVPHLEKDFDPRVVMPSAVKRYAWRPKRIVEVTIKDAGKSFDQAREKGYFDHLIKEGKERWRAAKDLAEEQREEYNAY
ncbi:hypothetical protein B0H65DRAFT_461665 [Neurospora tetraspora]|uniref:Uncharacterized protein n=1 Tax=Neurospora tetraspora TaxID=94610 RepID=A0AAE0MSQ4_9PEZI|nr:hypothetical protein B0H65DRAFT_461665 [Neurospora tetraspora]